MTDLDKGYPGNGGDGPRPEVRSMPFFPGPTGQAQAPPSTPGAAPPTPGAPPPTPGAVPPSAPPLVPAQIAGGRHSQQREAEGRITIDDEIIEKIATLAALEVDGVATLRGRIEPGEDGRLGTGPGSRGVRVHMHENTVSLDLGLVVEYGSVIMEVAKVVQSNVARVVGLMLGMRVTAVNVSVEDVQKPAEGSGRGPGQAQGSGRK
ncbi:Asp23/Gls24 family envelope stress response protein [Actinomadura rudentiformis]|uniref:Asp23/Gls24 family envelope stress response protein n=1 Tax=Actinomadura rudentiformis TaxID=359158 RepID=A0A6H9YPM3_9ACTN|nr:Asp23/Gls24 family envelope stress response protein [Actinomadura rudentiformis]KAB2341063.1 Asp23/Gls24 family envelope stress response protein [Actinomadura rudentiformis]